jgi:hypothetical protein
MPREPKSALPWILLKLKTWVPSLETNVGVMFPLLTSYPWYENSLNTP